MKFIENYLNVIEHLHPSQSCDAIETGREIKKKKNDHFSLSRLPNNRIGGRLGRDETVAVAVTALHTRYICIQYSIKTFGEVDGHCHRHLRRRPFRRKL